MLTAGCLEDSLFGVDVQDIGPLLVVNGHLNPDEWIQISVTQAIPLSISRGDVRNLRGARVDVFEEGRFVGTAAFTPPPRPIGVPPPPPDAPPQPEIYRAFYVLEYMPKPGMQYTIRVQLAGFPDATASDRVPARRPELPTLRVVSIDARAAEVKVEVTVSDNEPLPNGYHLKVYSQGGSVFFEGIIKNYVRLIRDETKLVETDGSGILFLPSGTNTGALIPDRILSQGTRTFIFSLDTFFVLDYSTLVLCPEWRSVTPTYFDYYSSLIRQEQTFNDPFVQPFRVLNNVQGGLGNVSGFVSSPESCVMAIPR